MINKQIEDACNLLHDKIVDLLEETPACHAEDQLEELREYLNVERIPTWGWNMETQQFDTVFVLRERPQITYTTTASPNFPESAPMTSGFANVDFETVYPSCLEAVKQMFADREAAGMPFGQNLALFVAATGPQPKTN